MIHKILDNTKGDRWIWLIVILLSLWSLLAVYSSTGTLAYKNDKSEHYYLVKHLVMIVGGLALMYFSHLLDYKYYAGISKILMVIAVPL
jgi:cell division protein FtsW